MSPIYGTTPALRNIIANSLGGPGRTSGAYSGWQVKDLYDEYEHLLGEAESICDRTDAQAREHYEADQARWKQLFGHGNNPGILAELRTRINEETEKVEAAKTRAAARHAARQDNDNPYSQTGQLRAFKGENAARNARDCGLWIRAAWNRSLGIEDSEAEDFIASRGWSIQATATEGTGSAGGYTVPDPLSAAFIEYRKQVGVAWQLSDVRPMSSDTLSIPKLTAGPTVTYPGEGATITDSDQTWGQIGLTAVKRSILEKVSNELRMDSLVDLGDQIASRMGYQFALQGDNEWLNGDGTATYGGEAGLLANIGSAGVNDADTGEDTWAELDIQDFTDTMALLPDEYAVDPAWVCSRAFYFTTMLRVAAEAGGNTINSIMDGNGMARPMFLGYPVYLTDQMPTASAASTISCLFGTFRMACVIGSRMPLEIAISTDRYFEQDLTAFRGLSRYDINWHNIGDSSNPGAVVALKTAS